MRRRNDEPRGWLKLVVPRDNHSAPFTAEQLYAAIHAGSPKHGLTQLVLSGTRREVAIYLGAERSRLTPLRTLVLATYPDADAEPSDAPLGAQPGTVVVGARWRLLGDRAYPVKTVREFDNSEPMAMTLGALAEAGDGEQGFVSLLLRPAPPAFHRRSRRLAIALATGADTSPWWLRLLALPADLVVAVLDAVSTTTPAAPGAKPAPPVVHADLDAMLKWINGKAAQPAFETTTLTGWAAADHARARAGHDALVGALGQFTVPEQNALVPASDTSVWSKAVAGWRPRRERCVLGVQELAGLCHMPGPDLVIPHLQRTRARRRELPRPTSPDSLVLAETTHRHHAEPVGVTVADLMTHAYLVGPSGTGKTSLLTRLVLELARAGTAAVVLDPHGDLTRQVLARLPDDAADRTVLFDLTDTSNIPTLNPLWLPTCEDDGGAMLARAVRSAAVTAVFTDLWGLHRAATPNLLHFLEAALAALVGAGDSCLAELPRFLTDAVFRRDVVRRANDPRVKARWVEFAQLGPDDRSRTVRAILNKAAAFDRNPLLGTVFGDRGPGLRFDELMDSGRLVLVNLPRGLVPEGTVELIGSLIVTLVYQAALAREARSADQRPPVVAVIDEFQEFALSTFAQVVTATRKYGLGLVVANQNLSRIHAVSHDVLSTLLANVSTLVTFRTSPSDADVLAPMLPPFEPADLVLLDAYECYWRAPVAGRAPHTVSARTLPLPPPIRTDEDVDRLAARVRVRGRPLVRSNDKPHD